MRPVFSLSPAETAIRDDPASRRQLAEDFARRRAFALSGVLTAGFAEILRQCWARTSFRTDAYEWGGIRQIEAEPRLAGRAICRALRRPEWLRWLSDVTAVGPLDDVAGLVTQFSASVGEGLNWHSDLGQTPRKLAITINLSDHTFEGGVFELREKASGKIVFAHIHDGPGSALIFEISELFEHRVSRITAGGPRRIFTGFFLAPFPTAG